MWAAFRELPPSTSADVTSHGDLTSGQCARLARSIGGILDVGGLGPADPGLDLVSAWHLLHDAPRQMLRDELGCDDIEWERGKA